MKHTFHQQQGAALIVALIFLIIITLLGVSSMDSTIIETNLAKNSREQNYALRVAENGLMLSTPVLNTQIQTLMTDSRERRFTAGEEVSIDRQDISTTAQTVTASSQNTQIAYKGKFGIQRGEVCGTAPPSSSQSYTLRYFETLTEGQSAPRQRSLKLRSGFCQAAPN